MSAVRSTPAQASVYPSVIAWPSLLEGVWQKPAQATSDAG
jgi:hypothetical protein